MKKRVEWENKHAVIAIIILIAVVVCIPILVEVGYRIIPGDVHVSADALLTYIGSVAGALIMVMSIIVTIKISREEMEFAESERFEKHRQDIKPELFMRAKTESDKVIIEIESEKNSASSIFFGPNIMIPVLHVGETKTIEMDIVGDDAECCTDKYEETYNLNEDRIPKTIELVYSDSEGNVILQKMRGIAGNEGVYEKLEAEYA